MQPVEGQPEGHLGTSCCKLSEWAGNVAKLPTWLPRSRLPGRLPLDCRAALPNRGASQELDSAHPSTPGPRRPGRALQSPPHSPPPQPLPGHKSDPQCGRGLTHILGGRGTAAHLLPWGKGLGGWWTAFEVSSAGMGSWAGRRGCSLTGGCRTSGRSAVPSAVPSVGGCMVSPAGQRRERGRVTISQP